MLTHARLALVCTVALVPVFVAGCDPVEGGTAQDGILGHTTDSGTSGSDGLLAVPVQVLNGQSAFEVVSTAGSQFTLSIEQVEDPSGEIVLHWEDWYGTDHNLTNAFYPEYRDLAFNWPVREDDGELEPGTWTVYVATTDLQGRYTGGVDVDSDLLVKGDSDLSQGIGNVRIVYADGVGDDDEVVSAIEASVDRWREIWDSAGLTMGDVTYVNSDADPDMDFPEPGNEGMADASDGIDGRTVVILVGEQIGGQPDYYGYAGGIPGPLVEGGRSGVELSWLTCAGGDGRFSDDDIELTAETLAHEVGHFQGLLHPVESGWDSYDALDDTQQCTSQAQCESSLGTNVMFPTSICDQSGCVDAEDYTDDQAGVVQRFTGTL